MSGSNSSNAQATRLVLVDFEWRMEATGPACTLGIQAGTSAQNISGQEHHMSVSTVYTTNSFAKAPLSYEHCKQI